MCEGGSSGTGGYGTLDQRVRQYADIVVYGREGQPQVLVEAKTRKGTSKQWVAKLRRNMYAHGNLVAAPYFLLALPDRFYLWRNIPNPASTMPPDFTIDALPVLEPFFERAGISIDDASEHSLELALSSWLETLTKAPADNQQEKSSEWLAESGLAQAILGGRVEVQALV